jgi:hypothetical protein
MSARVSSAWGGSKELDVFRQIGVRPRLQQDHGAGGRWPRARAGSLPRLPSALLQTSKTNRACPHT